jgi:hypothetical protein
MTQAMQTGESCVGDTVAGSAAASLIREAAARTAAEHPPFSEEMMRQLALLLTPQESRP